MQARDALVTSGFEQREAMAAVDEALDVVGVVDLEVLLAEVFRKSRE
jgi:hypothetical protein